MVHYRFGKAITILIVIKMGTRVRRLINLFDYLFRNTTCPHHKLHILWKQPTRESIIPIEVQSKINSNYIFVLLLYFTGFNHKRKKNFTLKLNQKFWARTKLAVDHAGQASFRTCKRRKSPSGPWSCADRFYCRDRAQLTALCSNSFEDK